MDVRGAKWLRPHEIVSDPRFFVDGASRFDVRQGANSDCWLLVAMANLTTNPTLFDHVVPKDQTFLRDYAGIWRFNIWQCGTWTEVVVDDRLPTKVSSGRPKLMFVHSKEKNEFWSALLEKAYAKLYGSYNELTSGWFCEAMVDFTGGMVERVSMIPSPPPNLRQIISKSLEKSSFICVFMNNDKRIKELILPNGLVKGHAYSLTKSQTVTVHGRPIVLLRLRNPWGRTEWTGAWSDSSPEWRSIPQRDKDKLGLVVEEDGEFWMPFLEFINNFDHLDICHLTPDLCGVSEGKAGWDSHFFKGEWKRGVNAGGYHPRTFYVNPQYRISLTQPDDYATEHEEGDKCGGALCTVLIGVRQRNQTRKKWHNIAFTAFRLESRELQSTKYLSKQYLTDHFNSGKTCPFKRCRENVVREEWEPGVYCIIPHTYSAGEEGIYYLRVYSEKQAHMEDPSGDEIGMAPIQKSLFFRENSDMKGYEVAIGSAPPSSDEENSSPSSIHISQSGENAPNEEQKPLSKKSGPSQGNRNSISRGKILMQKSDQEVFEYFQKLAGNENEIDWKGLQAILQFASKNPRGSPGLYGRLVSWMSTLFTGSPKKLTFHEHECRSMIALVDSDSSGKIDFGKFQQLWKMLQSWESVYLNNSHSTSAITATEVDSALREVGHNYRTYDVGRLVRKYGDEKEALTFNDFIMCCMEPTTSKWDVMIQVCLNCKRI